MLQVAWNNEFKVFALVHTFAFLSSFMSKKNKLTPFEAFEGGGHEYDEVSELQDALDIMKMQLRSESDARQKEQKDSSMRLLKLQHQYSALKHERDQNEIAAVPMQFQSEVMSQKQVPLPIHYYNLSDARPILREDVNESRRDHDVDIVPFVDAIDDSSFVTAPIPAPTPTPAPSPAQSSVPVSPSPAKRKRRDSDEQQTVSKKVTPKKVKM